MIHYSFNFKAKRGRMVLKNSGSRKIVDELYILLVMQARVS